MKFIDILWIGFGGFLGTVARYGAAIAFETKAAVGFPFATFLVNIIGSLLLGIIVGAANDSFFINPKLKLFLTIGFCGAFTTFSTLMLESYNLIKANQLTTLALYTTLSVILGFLSLYAGILIGKFFCKVV